MRNIAQFLILISLPLAALGADQLAFDAKTLVFHPAITDTEVIAVFHFANNGSLPITIEKIASSCSCTTSRLDKMEYDPGEKGVITTTFSVGEHTGLQYQTVSITTNEAGSKPIILTIELHLPPGPMFSQRIIEWTVGSTPDPKTVTITIPDGSQYRLTGAESDDRRIHVEMSPHSDASLYSIVITPLGTMSTFSGTVNVLANYRTFRLYVRVNASSSGK